ncbi:reverse transcriptase domain-containing protein [Tanacetum coccineum]
MVNMSLKKLKHHLAGFDVIIKERTTTTTITKGSWGFEHTKACFRDEIIPFVKALKDLFNTFDQYLIDELSEVQNVFHQMKQAVKKDIKEIETINIELDHRVSKLIAENEHLKQTYKQLYDSIKPTRIRSKEQCDALINQVNQKSVEISDLNVSLQEQGLVITAFKDELRKLKGKGLADNAITKHTIALEILKIDVQPIAPRLLNNRTAHFEYLRHTQEEAAILREIVEQRKSQNPLNNSLDSALHAHSIFIELIAESSTTPKRRNRRRFKQRVEPFSLEETSVVTMTDQRTMAELLQAPTEGYRDAIVIPAILAENFELKHGLLNLITSKQFYRFKKEDPHANIRWFNKITSTIKYRDVPNSSIKLILFPFSIEGATRIWLKKEPPRSILTWEDLAWDRFKDLLRACPHHGFTELHQLDTFDNALTPTDQDSLNDAAGVSTNAPSSSTPYFPEIVALADAVKAMLAQKSSPPASVKAIEAICVTCGGPHPYHQCLATNGNSKPSTELYPPPASPIQASIDGRCAPKPKHLIPLSVRANKQKLREKDDNLASKFVEIFREITFRLKTPVNENCSAVILKKLPEKLGDPGKFLIPCDFPELVECLALADLGASINLMPLSIWKKLSLPELTPTQMILELADRSTTSPSGIAEDVFVKVGKFHFPADFVVVDYVVDPRVPLILGRPFLRTARALIDVYGEELTLRVDDEAITFKVGQTSRYSYNDVVSINRIDVIDVACEEYAQEVLGFSDSSTSGNPTPSLDPILSTSSPSLIPFEEGDFILEEIEACLTNDSIPSGIDDDDFDSEGDLLLLEKLLNDDPSSPLPLKELHVEELKIVKSSIDDPPELELKDLPSHLEYAVLEGTDKLPVIIAKDLKEDEKVRLIKVLKSHKRAIAWKISDIKGIDPQFFIKLLDAGLIYPISDSHCVPKKGGITVIENDDNQLIPTRLVTGWRIPIDPKDQEKTTFTCPYGTFAYRRMPFGLCNALGTFQRYMMDIFHDMIEETMEVFMDDFLVFEDSFSSCLSHLDKMLKRCEDTNLVLNWEKCHFMVKEGIILGHKISKSGIEVDKAKVDVIAKLPHPTSVKGIRRFLGAENLAADHLSRLENPHQDVLENKEITKTISSGDSCNPTNSDKLMFQSLVLKHILERTVGENHASWSDKLDDALWAFRTAFKTPIGCTPYKLVYGKACHLPIELEHKAYWALKHCNFDLKTAGDHRKVQLNELNELRDQAYENSLIYKEKTKKIHDSKIKNRIFNVGDRVLLFNSRLKIFSGKLKTRWTGPFTVAQVFPYGTVELSQTDGPNFKVNGHRLKHYFGGDICNTPKNMTTQRNTTWGATS